MKLFSKEKLELTAKQTVITVFVFSLFSVIYQALLQNGIMVTGYISYLTNPLIFLMNFLPLVALMLIFLALTGSLRASFLCVNIPLTVFLLINEFKILFRDEPFKPTDIALLSETSDMLESYVLEVNAKIVLMVIAMIAMCVFTVIKIRNKKLPVLHRGISLICALAIILGSWFFVYSDHNIYADTRIAGNEYHESEVFANKGFVFSFISAFSGVVYQKPEGYSKEAALEILEDYPVDNSKKFPNVIGIMSESFFDMQKAENLEFLPGRNPYEKFNELKNEALYGELFVPGFAGGTASSEFEFVAGSNLTLIDPSMPTVYKTHINKPAYSLPYAFSELGYKTTATHPWHPWFYNRQNVYRHMRFDNFYSIEDIRHALETKNYYTTDNLGGKMIIEDYKKHMNEDPERGYFHFHVSVQNHGPYSKAPVDNPRLVRPEELSDEEYNTLENYADNINDAVEMLVAVKEYADSLPVPTIIVFFGDHLPQWDAEYNCYNSIGYELSGDTAESVIRQHTTPWIILGNDAFEKENPKAEKGDRGLISANFLSGQLQDFADMNISPYFRFVRELSKEVQVICSGFKISDGNLTDDFPPELEEKINRYKILQYYNLKEYKSPAR